MSSVEIEDVLSSIRRLVSEDLRPGHGGQVRQAPSGRLLLTPALRVVPGRAAEPEPEIEPEHEPAAVPEPARLQEEDPPETMAYAGDLHWPQPDTVEVDLDSVEDAELVEPLHLAQEWRETGWRDDSWRDGAWPLEAAAAPPEPVAPMDAHLADLAEAAAVAEILATPAEPERRHEAEPEFLGAEDFLIDEEVVRDLVRDIIREELQGALGERITRNVRKLVRAELNRALLARDLS